VFIPVGVVHAMMSLLSIHEHSSKAIQWIWYSLCSLCASSEIVSQLEESGVCKLAVDQMSKFLLEEEVALGIISVVTILGKYPSLNQSLRNEGVVSLLVECLSMHFKNAEVVEEACIGMNIFLRSRYHHNHHDAIENGGSTDLQYDLTVADKIKLYTKQHVVSGSKLCSLLMEIWTKYQTQERIIEESIKVLSTLVERPDLMISVSIIDTDSPITNLGVDQSIINEKLDQLIQTVRVQVSDSNFAQLMPKVVQLYQGNGVIIESMLFILSEFLLQDTATPSFSSLISQNSFFELIASVLNNYVDIVRICVLGCQIISLLATENSLLDRIVNDHSHSFLSLDHDSSFNLQKSDDVAAVLLKILARHYQFYYDHNDPDCKTQSNELSIQNSEEDTGVVNTRCDNLLPIVILDLISDFSSRNNELKCKFGSFFGCQTILDTLRYHYRRKKIIVAGCTALSSLTSNVISTDDSTSSRRFAQSVAIIRLCNDYDICGLIVDLSLLYQNDQEVLYFVCILVDSICSISESRKVLCERGVCLSLLVGLQTFRSGEGFVTVALSALGSLYEHGPSQSLAQTQITSSSDLAILLDIATRNVGNAVISQCCCRLLAFMAAGPNALLQSTLFHCGIVETVISILEKYHDESLDTTKFALLAIANLAYNQHDIVDLMHQRNVHRMTVRILQKYFREDFIVEACCRSICSLSKFSAEFGNLGVCELVLEALSTHSDSPAVLEWVCRAIGVLAEDRMNVIKLCEHHGPENIVATLEKHLQKENSLVQLSRKVLFKSTDGNATVSDAGMGSTSTTILHSVNGSSLSFARTSMNKEDKMPKNFLYAMGDSILKFNSFFHKSNATKHSDNANMNEGSVQWGIMAIYYMLKGSDCDSMYQQILYECGICNIIHNIILKYVETESISLACCKAIVTLCKGNEVMSSRFGAIGVCSQIVEIMQIFPASEKVWLLLLRRHMLVIQ
jgi:hypothetical protein